MCFVWPTGEVWEVGGREKGSRQKQQDNEENREREEEREGELNEEE